MYLSFSQSTIKFDQHPDQQIQGVLRPSTPVWHGQHVYCKTVYHFLPPTSQNRRPTSAMARLICWSEEFKNDCIILWLCNPCACFLIHYCNTKSHQDGNPRNAQIDKHTYIYQTQLGNNDINATIHVRMEIYGDDQICYKVKRMHL